MSSIVPGIDIPIDQMPVGMAFEGESSNSTGSDFLGALGKGLLGALGNSDSGSYRQAEMGQTPYTDRTRSMLNYLISEAINSFEPAKPTIS